MQPDLGSDDRPALLRSLRKADEDLEGFESAWEAFDAKRKASSTETGESQ